jgi:diketogulonate reductase-like aldo/keto reductase
MQKNNALLEVNTTDLTLLHHPCDTAEHSIQRWLDLEAALAAGLTKV